MNNRNLLVKVQSGYTLIELMIVVGIVGIVSSLAYGAFTGYTKEADRAQAQSDLFEISQAMERDFTQNRVYSTANVIPSFFNNRNPRYTLSIVITGSGAGYDVTAIADNSRDKYDLQLDELGVEGYKLHGSGSWISGWENIPD